MLVYIALFLIFVHFLPPFDLQMDVLYVLNFLVPIVYLVTAVPQYVRDRQNTGNA
jgi:hypothetical protein